MPPLNFDYLLYLKKIKIRRRKYEHLEYATFKLSEKFEDAYNVLLDDRRL